MALIFLSFSISQCFYFVFYSIKHSYLLTAKVTPDANDSFQFLHDVQELVDFLHVRHNLCFLARLDSSLGI